MRWVRLYTEITHDRKLRRLPATERWLWVTMLCLASKSPVPGTLLLSKDVPVTVDDLADAAAIPRDDVASGIENFKRQKMLEEDSGVYRLINWDKRQFVSDSSTERVRKHRGKRGQDDETLQKRYSNVTVTPPEYRVQSTDTDQDLDTDPPKTVTPHQAIVDLFTKHCPSLPQVRVISDNRKNNMRLRWKKYPGLATYEELFKKAEASDFLTGRKGKWAGCNFDWLLKEANMVKVLEGNYDNERGGGNGGGGNRRHSSTANRPSNGLRIRYE